MNDIEQARCEELYLRQRVALKLQGKRPKTIEGYGRRRAVCARATRPLLGSVDGNGPERVHHRSSEIAVPPCTSTPRKYPSARCEPSPARQRRPGAASCTRLASKNA